jgi:Ca2+-binding EF-hand superfamily protein
LNEKDIENIQGILSYDNKNKLDKMIKPLKDEMEIYEKRKDVIESFKYFDKDNNGLINVQNLKILYHY